MNPFSILSIFTGNPWVYAGVFALGGIMAGAGTYEVTSFIKNDQVKDLKLTAAETAATNAGAALQQFEDNVGRMTVAANSLTVFEDNQDAQFAALKQELQNATKLKPLPLDCKPDADRVRINSAAVALANKGRTAGSQTGDSMPDHP